jgi:hypothetical protein
MEKKYDKRCGFGGNLWKSSGIAVEMNARFSS